MTLKLSKYFVFVHTSAEEGAPTIEGNLKSFGGRLIRPAIGQNTKVHEVDLVSIGGRLVRFKDNGNNSNDASNLSSGGSFAVRQTKNYITFFFLCRI